MDNPITVLRELDSRRIYTQSLKGMKFKSITYIHPSPTKSGLPLLRENQFVFVK